MKLKQIILASILLFVATNALTAQSTTGRKIERTGKDIEKTGESVEKGTVLFKKIFKKKDKEGPQEQEANTDDNAPDPSTGGTTIEESPKIGETKKITQNDSGPAPTDPNQLKPGDIHPDAVALDVDELLPFYNGAAIVGKGRSTALINAKGEFIVPFNTYDFDLSRSKNGFFLVRNKSGFLNSKGTFIKNSRIDNIRGNYGVNGSYIVTGEQINFIRTLYFIDIEGKEYLITNTSSHERGTISNGLIDFQERGRKRGYKNINNTIVINAIYDETHPFYEGAAVVGKKNEFGEMKYGYIDTQGKPITPLQFSKEPESFSDGRAKVRDRNSIEFFIDKSGKVVYTDNEKHYFFPFSNGYSRALLGIKGTGTGGTILSKEGKIVKAIDLLVEFGIPKGILGYNAEFMLPNSTAEFFNNDRRPSPKIMFTFTSKVDNYHYYGLIDVHTKKAFYGTFNPFIPRNNLYDLTYDPLSKLTYAVFKKANNPKDIIEGYINQEGIFMIVKGEASKW